MKIELTALHENADGSVDVSINTDEHGGKALIAYAVEQALKEGIANMKSQLLDIPVTEEEKSVWDRWAVDGHAKKDVEDDGEKAWTEAMTSKAELQAQAEKEADEPDWRAIRWAAVIEAHNFAESKSPLELSIYTLRKAFEEGFCKGFGYDMGVINGRTDKN